MVRVLLVEDNEVYRSSLEFLLGARGEIEIVDAVAAGADAVTSASSLEPDVALVDFRLPDMDGTEVTEALRRLRPAPAVICLTAAATEDERAAVVAAGAAGVVEKGDVQALVEAIQAVAEGA